MRILITGITGFVGSHLGEFLLKKKDTEVHGIERWRSKTENIDHIKNKIILHECDIKDATSVRRVIDEVRPDRIFHLAAQSFVHTSWHTPAETLITNLIGELNLFEAIRNIGINPYILVAGSSEEYGLVYENELPIKETNPLRPLSPYAVSKVGQDLLAYQYYQSYKLNTIRTRAFNHSISKWSPVILKDGYSDLIDICYISEIRDKQKKCGYLSGKLVGDVQIWDLDKHNLYIWSNNTWSKLYSISCHPVRNGKLVRLMTRGGFVELTDNHSIIGEDLKSIDVSKLQIGHNIKNIELPNSEIMEVHSDVAWFFGLFVSEGCITTNKAKIDNKDKLLLDKVKKILLRHFGVDSYYSQRSRGVYRLSLRKPFGFAQWLKPQVYASDRNKKVPKCILNANKDAKLAFLEGYNEGDGLQKGYGSYKFKNFKTESRILAMGLYYLIKNTTGQEICINYGDRRTGYLSLNLHSDIKSHSRWGKHLEIPENVVKYKKEFEYEEEVWDFSTENEMFHSGIGNLLVHNTGPRRGEVFSESNFARQIALTEKGKQEPVIYVGNLSAKRDFTDVRDIVRAYWLCLEKCRPGEVYNISSQKAYSIREILNMLLEISKVKVKIKREPERLRPSDVPILIGDSEKFRKETGWMPEIPFEKTLEDLLRYWRERV